MSDEVRLVNANDLPLGKFRDPRTEWHQGWNDALDAAKESAPTVDAVEVVRCKDCIHCDKYMNWNNRYYYGCDWTHDIHEVEPEHFCSYGERKTDV